MNRLMRSRTDRKIAGICGGIAQYNGWDPTLVRLAWVALVVFGGTGVLLYLILWVVVPEEPMALAAQGAAYPVPPQYPVPPAYPVPPPYSAPAVPPMPGSDVQG